jgi:hypothetical protein
MNTMPEINKETLKNKKQELEDELSSIQDEIDHSLDKVRNDVSSSINPLTHVRKNPLPMVGIAVLIGFLAGKEGSSSPSSSDDSDSDKLTSTLWYEVKRLITRKGISYATDYLETLFQK